MSSWSHPSSSGLDSCWYEEMSLDFLAPSSSGLDSCWYVEMSLDFLAPSSSGLDSCWYVEMSLAFVAPIANSFLPLPFQVCPYLLPIPISFVPMASHCILSFVETRDALEPATVLGYSTNAPMNPPVARVAVAGWASLSLALCSRVRHETTPILRYC